MIVFVSDLGFHEAVYDFYGVAALVYVYWAFIYPKKSLLSSRHSAEESLYVAIKAVLVLVPLGPLAYLLTSLTSDILLVEDLPTVFIILYQARDDMPPMYRTRETMVV